MKKEGTALRHKIKEPCFNFIKNETSPKDCKGLKTAEIFRKCGLDWGDQTNATTSQQQFWLVGGLRELEKENRIAMDQDKFWKVKH